MRIKIFPNHDNKDARNANMVDLHVHSNKSDGTLSPSELVAYAVEKGLTAFALTDHDTTEGLKEAMETAASFVKAGKQIEVILN